ncbi:MAG: toxin-activating lysine-acyltransferase [Alphaproteobacteria bacterium]|jgi:cytolysin-activating lysine-acyltransferase|nr:toxin-activating lysine-acyltransferase [Alphaproteobacteria bacterium]
MPSAAATCDSSADTPADIDAAVAVRLMGKSEAHRHLFLADLDWRVLPAIAHKQFRLFHKDGKPVAFASWAMVSDAVAERLGLAGADAGDDGAAASPRPPIRLKPEEWRSGERRVIVDVVAPFGGAEAVVKALQTQAQPQESADA